MPGCSSCTAVALELIEVLGLAPPVGSPDALDLSGKVEEALGCGQLRRQRHAAARLLESLTDAELDPYPGRQIRPMRRIFINELITYVNGARGMLEADPRPGFAGETSTPTAPDLRCFAAVEALAEAVGAVLDADQRVRGAALVARRSALPHLSSSTTKAADLLRQLGRLMGEKVATEIWPPARRQRIHTQIASALERLDAAPQPPETPRPTVTLGHRRVELPTSPFGHSIFADIYPAASPTAPVLLWLGGAIDDLTYERRRRSAPDDLAREVLQAGNVGAMVSLLVVSTPPGVRNVEGTRQDAILVVLRELLHTAHLEPGAVRGIVGNSLGAHIAFTVLPVFEQVGRIAAVAGVGMLEAVEACGGIGPVREVGCFSNYADPARPHTLRFVEWLAERQVPTTFISRRGGHAFEDYTATGAVREAFAFVTPPGG